MIAELLTLAAGSWAVVAVWERWDRHRQWRRHADEAIALTGPRGPEDDPAAMHRIADLAADLAFDRETERHRERTRAERDRQKATVRMLELSTWWRTVHALYGEHGRGAALTALFAAADREEAAS